MKPSTRILLIDPDEETRQPLLRALHGLDGVTVTGVLGAPFLLYLLIKTNRSGGSI